MTMELPVPTGAELDEAEALLSGRTIAVLTGAGISTDSGIPDYRGAGSVHRTPMTIDQFMSSDSYRKRFWAGSHLGWSTFANIVPNAGHEALSRLERFGAAAGVITQNVDGLHSKAGSRKVVELHGGGERIRCLNCGQLFARTAIADQIAADNPWLVRVETVQMRPDGDVDFDDTEQMVVPVCTVCGGRLKPDIVYFGELIPQTTFAQARALVGSADALLVAGSSLTVNSGIRVLSLAAARKLPIVIINRGATRADARATLKIDAGTSPTLTALTERLTR